MGGGSSKSKPSGPDPCDIDPVGHNKARDEIIKYNNNQKKYWNRQKVPHECTIYPINIPDFKYPEQIKPYILSQTLNFRVTYIPPGGSTPVDLKIPTTPPDMNEEDKNLNGTLSGWQDVPLFPLGSPLDSETVPNISTPTPAPTIYIQDAYSEPTRTPTTSPSVTIPKSPPISPITPLIWEAAITAMIYTKGLNLPITKKEQIYTIYIDLQENILKLLNKEGIQHIGQKNAAALIYFCTVTIEVFKTFNEFISYNHLNGKYPGIFPDSKAYRKFCMINYYSIQARKLFNRNTVLNKHISINDRMMKYMVPSILNSVIYQLQT